MFNFQGPLNFVVRCESIIFFRQDLQDYQDFYSFVTFQKKVTKRNPDGGKIKIADTESILIKRLLFDTVSQHRHPLHWSSFSELKFGEFGLIVCRMRISGVIAKLFGP